MRVGLLEPENTEAKAAVGLLRRNDLNDQIIGVVLAGSWARLAGVDRLHDLRLVRVVARHIEVLRVRLSGGQALPLFDLALFLDRV